jgi:drug/metabolite transporter (DMT)-like permease
MLYLLIVSIAWGFSFGLFSGYLTNLDPTLVAFLRLFLAVPFFAPFFRPKGLTVRQLIFLACIGGVQFGAMYVLLNLSFQYLQSWQVALFTIFTPLYLGIIDGIWEERFHPFGLLMALIAIIGAAVIHYDQKVTGSVMRGVMHMQLSNFCFALGQVAYRHIRREISRDKSDFSLQCVLFIGASIVTALSTTYQGTWGDLLKISWSQWGTVIYMGVVASGLCFYMWNSGATMVSIGTLSVFNNMKIPIAMFISLTVFGESTNYYRLFIGSLILGSAMLLSELNERYQTNRKFSDRVDAAVIGFLDNIRSTYLEKVERIKERAFNEQEQNRR